MDIASWVVVGRIRSAVQHEHTNETSTSSTYRLVQRWSSQTTTTTTTEAPSQVSANWAVMVVWEMSDVTRDRPCHLCPHFLMDNNLQAH